MQRVENWTSSSSHALGRNLCEGFAKTERLQRHITAAPSPESTTILTCCIKVCRLWSTLLALEDLITSKAGYCGSKLIEEHSPFAKKAQGIREWSD